MASAFEHLNNESMRVLYRADNPDISEEELNKLKGANLRKSLAVYANETAIKFFVENLKQEDLSALLSKKEIDHETKGNKQSKRVLQKRLSEFLISEGIKSFLVANADTNLLKAILERLDTEPEGNTKDALATQLADGLEEIGAILYFESFDVATLADAALEAKLYTDASKSPSKNACIEALTSGDKIEFSKKKEKKAPTFSKKKLPIEQGISYEDIFQWYKVEEIQEWCKSNGVKTSGSKKDLIKRILAFLDGDKENTLSKPSSRKAGKKAGAPAKAAKAKKPAPSKESKSEKPVRETRANKGSSSAAPAIDVEKASLKELKDFCTEKKLNPKGNKKQDYVDAIKSSSK